MSSLTGLQCHLCKTMFPAEALYVCDRCLGPLEPVYDYASIKLTRELIERRPTVLCSGHAPIDVLDPRRPASRPCVPPQFLELVLRLLIHRRDAGINCCPHDCAAVSGVQN